MTEHAAEPPTAVGLPLDLAGLAADRLARLAEPRPVRSHAPVVRSHPGVDLLADVHAARDRLAPMAVDALVFAVLAQALLPAAWPARLVWPVGMLFTCYLGHVYAERDSVQTRGVLWYPHRLIAPATLVTAVTVATHAASMEAALAVAGAAIAALTLLRGLTWALLHTARQRGYALRRTLVIGDPVSAGHVWQRLVEFPEAGLLPTRLLTFRAAQAAGAVEREVAQGLVEHVVLVSPGHEETPLTASLPDDDRAPFVSVVPALSDCFLDPRSATEVGGLPLIPLGRVTRERRHFPGKRVFDVVVGMLLLTVSAPAFAAIAVAVKLDDGGPVFYRQRRVGRGGNVFAMVKFRTMVVGADGMIDALRAANITDGLLFKVPNDPRVTRIGRWLRASSLDELPQLWNVLKGEMSIVGPRPVAADPEDFTATENERHTTRPGITGYWQLSGGPRLSYDEMIRLDLAYIRSWSIWLDARLVLRTIPAVVHRHGAH